MIGRGGEGLVNVKYLKIINKTFPPDDKDPTASTLKLGLVRERALHAKEDKFPVSSAQLAFIRIA